MDIKQQIADRIKKANNILVTVSANPSVDQLAACIGLTLVCNKLGKHATAVFSGEVPSIIEFLQPEKTIEKNTDSLRDFIIALDKSKADKLRYKVEDKVVKIFITPYRTSISEKDLDFSQGDFNVDVIVALGVHSQVDLDQAITAHGRILHDATVATINVAPGGELGAMNWLDAGASSLSEMAAQLSDVIDQKLVDGQIATAFLTGIVAETGRFSNAKTSPQTMSISAELMSLGANQQLVASKLEAPAPAAAAAAVAPQQTLPPKNDDGTLEIKHADEAAPIEKPVATDAQDSDPKLAPQIHIDEHGELQTPLAASTEAPTAVQSGESSDTLPGSQHTEGPRLILQPPTFASELTANATPEDEEQPSGNPLNLPSVEAPTPLLSRTPLTPPTVAPEAPMGRTIEPPESPQPLAETAVPAVTLLPADTPASITPAVPAPTFEPTAPSTPTLPSAPSQQDSETLSQIEEEVHSPHLAEPAAPTLPPINNAMPVSPQPTSLPPVNASFSPVPAAPFAVPATQNAWTPSASPAPYAAPFTPVAPTPTDAPIAAPVEDEVPPSVDSARDAVDRAISQSAPSTPEPIQALNAQTLGGPLHADASQPVATLVPNGTDVTPGFAGVTSVDPNTGLPQASPSDAGLSSNAPPPVPPPMLPPSQ